MTIPTWRPMNPEENEALLRRLPEYIDEAEQLANQADKEFRSGDSIFWDGLVKILQDYQTALIEFGYPHDLEP